MEDFDSVDLQEGTRTLSDGTVISTTITKEDDGTSVVTTTERRPDGSESTRTVSKRVSSEEFSNDYETNQEEPDFNRGNDRAWADDDERDDFKGDAVPGTVTNADGSEVTTTVMDNDDGSKEIHIKTRFADGSVQTKIMRNKYEEY